MRHSTRNFTRILMTMTIIAVNLLWLAVYSAAAPKPDQPADGWIPTPSFTAPEPYQKFTFTSTLTVNLKVKIPNVQTQYTVPGPFDFVAYAKASPFTEKWHIEMVKLGPNGEEVKIQTFEGLITGYQFSLPLNANWFKKHGPGKYGAKAYLSQTTSQGKTTGLATGRGFEIVSPPVKMSDQKPGNVMAVPPKDLPPPPK